jgi:hypothetical protein
MVISPFRAACVGRQARLPFPDCSIDKEVTMRLRACLAICALAVLPQLALAAQEPPPQMPAWVSILPTFIFLAAPT